MKTLKGTLLLLQPKEKTNSKSVYHVDYGTCEFYTLQANVRLDEKTCHVHFNYYGDPYELVLSNQGNGHYKGGLYVHNDREESRGNASLDLLNSNNKVMLVGDYTEDDNGFFNCFLELTELKKQP